MRARPNATTACLRVKSTTDRGDGNTFNHLLNPRLYDKSMNPDLCDKHATSADAPHGSAGGRRLQRAMQQGVEAELYGNPCDKCGAFSFGGTMGAMDGAANRLGSAQRAGKRLAHRTAITRMPGKENPWAISH